jgi:nicotinamide-nucleotide amidase
METFVEELSILLVEKELTLTTAESCTGGMIAVAITDRAGSSNIFDRGFITYSNDAKKEQLGVPAEIIDTFGAVSRECAEAMALGALKNSTADICVSVTGIAGPSGGSENKPVGLVFIGIGTLSHHSFVKEYMFEGSRSEIRKQAATEALNLLLEAVRAI